MEFSPIFRKPDDEHKSSDDLNQKKKVDYSSLGMNKKEKEKNDPAFSIPELNVQNAAILTDKFIEAKQLYEKGVRFVSKIVESGTLPNDIDKILSLIKELISSIQSGEQELIELTLSKEFSSLNPVSLNFINVSIITLALGLSMDLRENELIEVGVAALLHDVGMINCLDLASLNRTLSEPEYQRIKMHPQEGRAMLERSGYKLMTNVLETAQQEHERMDGSGYPNGLQGDQINKYAKIIGFVDVYEALTHHRPYREANDALASMKLILVDKDKFGRKVVKTFLEKIGLCPRGTIVELNTKEVARVIKHNPGYPMAPKIEIILDSHKKKLITPKEVDLSAKSTIHIAKCL